MRAGGDVPQRGPRAKRVVSADEFGLVHAAVLKAPEHDGPALGALAVAVLDREKLLDAVIADPDHAAQAQPVVLAEADLDVPPSRNK